MARDFHEISVKTAEKLTKHPAIGCGGFFEEAADLTATFAAVHPTSIAKQAYQIEQLSDQQTQLTQRASLGFKSHFH